MDLQSLQKAVRRASTTQVWSQGVRLSREDAVTGESADPDEVVLRVKAPGRAVAPTVVLYLEDLEWECDCPNSEDTCAHVVAAVLALVQARQQGHELPQSQSAGGKVRYHFRREGGGLALDRVIVAADGAEHPIPQTLSALISGRTPGPSVAPEQSDLSVDQLLGTRVRGRLPADRVIHLLTALAGHGEIVLDGEPVSISDEVLVPRAVVEDSKGGARLTIARDPRIDEVVTLGVARCAQVLHRLGETELSGQRLEHLPRVEEVPRTELHTLLEQTVPALERRIPVEVRTRRAPEVARDARPDIRLDVRQEGHRLAVLPTLVYVERNGDEPIARIDGGRLVHLRGPVPVRDEAGEKYLLQRLRDQLNMMPGRRVEFEGRDAVSFQKKLADWSGRLTGDVERERFLDAPPIIPRLQLDGAAADIYFEAPAGEGGAGGEGDAQRIDAATVMRAWRQGDGFVALPAGGWAPLPQAWLRDHGHLVLDLLAARDERDQVPPFALPDLARLCALLEHPPPPGLDALAPLFEQFTELPPAPLPDDLRAELRGYQHTGVRWLSFLRDAGLGAVLADDMGLGKTLQTLCALRGRSLVVCPTSVVHNWADELRRFRPALRVALYHGPRRELDPEADVVLTSYALLRLDIEQLSAIAWDAVVLDEAQAIKNPESQVARAAFRLDAGFRVALSGTPVENRLDELWSLFHFVNRGLLGGRKSFKERYADPVARGEDGAAEQLRARIRPFLLRRRKREVAPELPPRTEAVLHCELSDSERAAYDAVRAATQRDVLERLAHGGGVMEALEALLRLRQAACHPALLPGREADTSAKMEMLVDALSVVAAEGGKALVFSQWTGLLDLIEPHLRAAEISFNRLDGSTRDRGGVVAAFQDESGPTVMLISLKAGGTGLNLTAADHVFLCDPWWNPAVEEQAADRAHRIGQDRPVMVYRLVSKDTVEERILALQEQKRALAEAAIGEGARAAQLTRDDLMALLAAG
ncbi:DEAD/DEAH box helicase [Haliangium ochraceum]|uniref:SNF2-related protein n=1 Tax=Haliangium ochraceum (strain DSM 14365 / JCM 11303 / SMP-2) TaxID=502025 RepID=D0LXY6_HALO1|nr:DEAD/DEAH box helicase [Haliangium ochraceum]ACY14341.1 SNF2-related protein [Haliangium ochraceum DSM 14365]